MAVVRWTPMGQLATLQSDMARFMNQFFGTSTINGGNGGSTWLPAVDVAETENELVLSFDLPGLNEDQISIELEENVLTVTGQRERKHEQKDENFYRYERRFGTFARSVALPAGVTEEDITANYENGVLEIRVPKPEEQRRKRIQIGTGATAGEIEGTGTRKS